MTFLLEYVHMFVIHVCVRVHVHLYLKIEIKKKRKYLWEKRCDLYIENTDIARNDVAPVNHRRLYLCFLSNGKGRDETGRLRRSSHSLALRVGISFSLRSYSNLLLERSSRLADAKTTSKGRVLPCEFRTRNPSNHPSKIARRFKRYSGFNPRHFETTKGLLLYCFDI